MCQEISNLTILSQGPSARHNIMLLSIRVGACLLHSMLAVLARRKNPTSYVQDK